MEKASTFSTAKNVDLLGLCAAELFVSVLNQFEAVIADSITTC